MKIVENFPRTTKVMDGEFITLSDGVRLAAKIWLPDDAENDPVPAIIEYLPYRYQDGTSERDAMTHPYFAGHGYASVRVDMRGAGNSEGVLLGEYLKQEQDDAIEIIDWVCSQPWCTGSVGIIGISWGGFNGLQIAARRPTGLKAIVSICSTDDRYADDIHYMGGALLLDNIAWSTYMFSINTTPPDPQLVGEKWEELWLGRLKHSGFWLEQWFEHQHRDEFYQHGSVCENYDDIECAVYAVGGWADGYSNSVFRLLSNLNAPCKALIGPWAHKYPHFAGPGPSIGFLQECLRWWDYWMKGVETGIMDEPVLRCWMQDSAPPRSHYEFRPGRWVAEDQWPSANIQDRVLHIGADGLSNEIGDPAKISISSPQTVGRASGAWCPHGEVPDQAGDQRIEAGGCANFDTEALSQNLETLGAPVVTLELECDQTDGLVAVCLNEVLADGAIARISYGILNLTHRDGHLNPQPLVAGERYKVSLQLNEISHSFVVGSRIRLSISTSYWPTVWPSPRNTTIELSTLGSTLSLPVRTPRSSDANLAEFQSPECAPLLRKTVKRQPNSEFTVTENIGTGDVVLRNWFDEGETVYDDYDGWTVESTHEEFFSINPNDPNSAECDITWTEKFSRREFEISSKTRTVVTSTPTHFELDGHLEAWKGNECVHEQRWKRSIKRNLV